jgi:hypothetical protein
MVAIPVKSATSTPTGEKPGLGSQGSKRKSIEEGLAALKKKRLQNLKPETGDLSKDHLISPGSSGSVGSSSQVSTPTSVDSTATSEAWTPVSSDVSPVTSDASPTTSVAIPTSDCPIVKASNLQSGVGTNLSNDMSNHPGTQSKNTPTPPRGPPIVKAGLLELTNHVRFQEVSVNKNGTRSVPVCSADTGNSKVYIQLGTDSGGSIPPFGLALPDSDNSTPKLILSISDTAEYESLSLKFRDDAIQTAFDNRGKWWNYPVSMSQLTDGYYNILPEGRPKKDGNGTWDPQIKLKLPMTDAGELDTKQCDIRNADGSPVSIYDLPGRKWDKLIMKLTSVYFLSKYSWGFSKSLFKLILAPDDRVNEDPTQINFI